MTPPGIVRRHALPILTALLAAACGDSTGVGESVHLRVLLTDAGAEYIGEASVDIGRVELLRADDGERVVLSEDGTDGPIDLLDLQGAVTTVLADAEIEAGTYAQIRLIVESAGVTLADGYRFRDGTTDKALTVPSGAQTGIKLNLKGAGAESGDDAEGAPGGVVIASDQTVLVLDFDVTRSFRIQGRPDTPAGILGVHFQPTLRVVVEDAAGTISGTLTTALDGVSVEGLVVTAAPTMEEAFGDYQTRAAAATADADGVYTIHFLVPGTYDVSVETPTGLTTSPVGVEVTVGASEAVEGIDFSVASTG